MPQARANSRRVNSRPNSATPSLFDAPGAKAPVAPYVQQGYARSRRLPLFSPSSREPFKLSRSKLDMFMQCARCFYLDRRLGIAPPSGPVFTLNVAVDTLLKKEFDIHRAHGTQHPLLKTYGVDAVPLQHPDIDTWRTNFVGIQHLHVPTNFLVFGAVDDLWVNSKGQRHVVDYKATSKAGEVAELQDTKWHNQYRRQVEVYQWLLRQNGFTVSDTASFVYVNGKKDRAAFDGKLEFDVRLIAHQGNGVWVDGALQAAHRCLVANELPVSASDCDYCRYRAAAQGAER